MFDFKKAVETGLKRAQDENYFLSRVKELHDEACASLNETCEKEYKYEIRVTPENGPRREVVMRRHIRGAMDQIIYPLFTYNLYESQIFIQSINTDDKLISLTRPMLDIEYANMLAEVFMTAKFGDYIKKYASKQYMENFKNEKNS